uniref:uncharacterized protein LOC120339079 isoform X2 n=2 Tax=Styela clava TaxID=7725 RepID=UPI001939A952|nr:uncharacterized protein LOC120339079 isoform X2 [Styela clava]
MVVVLMLLQMMEYIQDILLDSHCKEDTTSRLMPPETEIRRDLTLIIFLVWDVEKMTWSKLIQKMFYKIWGTKKRINGKSRKRRSIRGITSRMGKLKAFKRWSTQQKEFIVNDTTAVVCPDGYYHFQDSCYKFVRTPMASFTDASKFCANDGGYLAHVNSNQELLYIMDTIGKKDTWFGGIHQSLNRDDISVEFVTKRIKRGHEDEDLVVLANLFNEIYLNEDTRKIIESFEPDLAGLSRKEINKIIRVLGGTSESDIPLLKEAKLLRLQNVQDMLTTASMRTRTTQHMTTTVSSRNRRQAGTPPSSSGDSSEPSTGVFTTIATSTENATLALAKKYPDQKDYFGSGEQDPECSWFNDGKVVETSGDEVCNRDKAFFCERPKIDLFEPSRITDLKVKVTEDLNIVRLVWTATGDDKTNGRAKEYEIRNLRTKRARKLARNFKDGELLSFAAILNGSVDVAKISGEREELVVNLTEITGCPPHAALDLIILLPRRVLSPSSTSRIEKESTLGLFRTLFSIFKISTYEVQVSVVAIQDQLGRVLLRDSTSANEVLNSIRQGLEQDNRLRQEVRYHDTVKILEDMKSRGRSITPKILLSILTEEDMEELITYENTTDMFKIIVGVGIANESDVRAVVSDPPCENAIFASTWKNLNETYREVASQLCYARNDEYQAWGIVAVDEGGLRSEPSNIVSNIIHNHRRLVDCPPEPELPQPSVAGIDVTVVTIAITIPLAAILGIVGAVICFGQVKKYRKKKREKKERKEREAEEAAAEAKRAEAIKNAGIRGNVRANMVGLLQNVRRNSNLKLKINKTAPVTQPPV